MDSTAEKYLCQDNAHKKYVINWRIKAQALEVQ